MRYFFLLRLIFLRAISPSIPNNLETHLPVLTFLLFILISSFWRIDSIGVTRLARTAGK